MQAFYFGPKGRQLFGAYHPPQTRRPAAPAVVLCYPGFHEYMRTHWAFRKLANLLARQGAHVLRFDWSGTGDSAGELEEASVAQWGADLRAAAAELQDLSGARRTSLVGLRLGAALAVQAVAQGLAVRDLVLWEPIARGREHLADLARIERQKYGNMPNPPPSRPDEVFGYPLVPRLRAELEALDLGALGGCAAERVLLFASDERPDHGVIEGALRDRAGRPPERRLVREDAAEGAGVLLSTRVLQEIAQAIAGGAA